MRRGEIWWADLLSPIRSEPGYRRPVLIIQANSFNESRIRTVVVAAISSNVRLADAPGNVLLPPETSGLPRPSVVNVSQILTMDRAFLTEIVTSLGASYLRRVEDGLRRVMAL